jgi:hypothetical protein
MSAPQIPLGSRVSVAEPISFGGGRSPWFGRTGTVTKLLRTSRAVLVKLDDDGNNEPFMFFTRELLVIKHLVC